MTAEVGFSYEWDLKFGNSSVNVPFSGLKFTHAIKGFGNSGVATGQFEFDIYDKLGTFAIGLLEHTEVHLEEKNNRVLPSRKYYISKRSVNNNVCHFTAYDIMNYVDQDFDNAGFDPFFDDDGKTSCGNVLSRIQEQCGFTSIGTTASGLEFIRFTKDQLANRTCRAILEEIAKAMCGVWIATRENGIVLSCLGDSLTGMSICDKFTKINYHGRQKITKLICINSDSGAQREFSTSEYGTVIKIESPFAAAGTDLDSTVWNRIQGYVYQAWKCEKSMSNAFSSEPFPAATSRIFFGETGFIANNVKITPDSTGIYISAGCDPQDEEQWKYDDYLTRSKIGINELVGNAKITNTGRHTFINLNK